MSDLRSFLRSTMDLLEAHQTLRAGDKPDGPECLALTRTPSVAWTSVGRWDGTKYELYPVPAKGVELDPTCMDVHSIGTLRAMAKATHDPRGDRLADNMMRVLADHGFHARSGLLLFGSMTDFDIRTIKPAGFAAFNDAAYFKPGHHFLDWDTLWKLAPAATARFCKATYFGLVTRPADMAFNRFCTYDFDDAQRTHANQFHPVHCGFAYSAASLLHFWGMLFAHDADPESLDWGDRMTKKWEAVRHPDTGLIPHFFGSVDPKDPDQSPRPFIHANDGNTALLFLDAAAAYRRRPGGEALADRLESLGKGVLRGIARHAWKPDRKLVVPWINLDGSEYTKTAFYAFRTQADKDEALRVDPRVGVVEVHEGSRFFTSDPWALGSGTGVPLHIAQGARRLRDPVLIDAASVMLREAGAQARQLTGEFNERGRWTFDAAGHYIHAMTHLHHATGDKHWLHDADEIAQRQARWLPDVPVTPDRPEWWRFPMRAAFLEALAELEIARG